MITKEQIIKDLIAVANSQIGVREHGFNKGKEVEEYQKAVDGKAQQEAWCMCFVQWVTMRVCKGYGIKSPLYASESTQSVYNHTLAKYLSSFPDAGFVFIQQNRNDAGKGHTGFCKGKSIAGVFPSTEGNTDGSGGSEGDGVYAKYRYTAGNATKKMRGFINLPQMIYDAIQTDQTRKAS